MSLNGATLPSPSRQIAASLQQRTRGITALSHLSVGHLITGLTVTRMVPGVTLACQPAVSFTTSESSSTRPVPGE
jgi:hypothetical protein